MGAAAANLVAVPLAAMAQQAVQIRRIGYMAIEDEAGSGLRNVILPALRDLGWIEGKNLIVEGRFADGKLELFPAFAAELVRLKVELILTASTAATIAAKNATANIPIVIFSAADPVRSGLVASLAHPGGNITGTSSIMTELRAKRVQLLHELLPAATRVGELVNTQSPILSIGRDEYEQAYRSFHIQPIFVEVTSASEWDKAVAEVARQRGQALIVSADGLFTANRVQIMSAALRYALPTMVDDLDVLKAGGLMRYAVSEEELGRHAAVFIDKILKGALPADLPVEQPTRLMLTINLKTAKALGITIPQSLLLRADEVIQ
jgi:putative ABC transport system substrate-binding protein